MRITKFNYSLPEKLIANSPANPRDSSKLLILDRKTGEITHDVFYNLPKYLTKNDFLVFNNTKVFPARLFGTKSTGGKIEILLVEKNEDGTWEALHRGKIRINISINFNKLSAKVINKKNDTVTLMFDQGGEQLLESLQKIGHTPLPPYIKSDKKEKDLRKLYQTVYAKDIGSTAAPTAGFHFTNELLDELTKQGVQTEFITLHVGLGTFAPVKAENLEDHHIHSEKFEVDSKTIKSLNIARNNGKRIIAVGTTTTRVLESLQMPVPLSPGNIGKNGKLKYGKIKSSTELFIYPPYKFNFVDAMITNFHLPKSTLLALVSAFISSPNTHYKFKNFESSLIGKAYQEAIEKNYRFYSFGDTMLIL